VTTYPISTGRDGHHGLFHKFAFERVPTGFSLSFDPDYRRTALLHVNLEDRASGFSRARHAASVAA